MRTIFSQLGHLPNQDLMFFRTLQIINTKPPTKPRNINVQESAQFFAKYDKIKQNKLANNTIDVRCINPPYQSKTTQINIFTTRECR